MTSQDSKSQDSKSQDSKSQGSKSQGSKSQGSKPYRSSWMTEELYSFRDQFRKFLAKDLAPHAGKWRQQKMVDRSAWRALGEMGALLPRVPEAYGGLGATFAYDAAVFEDMQSVVPDAMGGVTVRL